MSQTMKLSYFYIVKVASFKTQCMTLFYATILKATPGWNPEIIGHTLKKKQRSMYVLMRLFE